jgi:hypothetical protein
MFSKIVKNFNLPVFFELAIKNLIWALKILFFVINVCEEMLTLHGFKNKIQKLNKTIDGPKK